MLKEATIRQFRNFEHAELELTPGINLFEGSNASGKTSLLEALFVLFRGKSFRVAGWRPLVHDGTEGYSLSALVEYAGISHRVRHRRTRSEYRLELDGVCAERLSELLGVLPVMFIGPQVGTLVSGAPALRRRWMDFALFHVKHRIRPAWGRFNLALKQRNAAIRSGSGDRALDAIEIELVRYGEELTEERRSLVQAINPLIPAALIEHLGLDGVELGFRCGWNEAMSLEQAMKESRPTDRQLGYTHAGPQRADFVIKRKGARLRDRLSRGQEKILSTALLFGEAQFLGEQAQIAPVILMDDVSAEMDLPSQEKILGCLQHSGLQICLTSLPSSESIWRNAARQTFHVKQGACVRVL